MQCWVNVENVGPTLYKCYTNVSCLLVYKSLINRYAPKSVYKGLQTSLKCTKNSNRHFRNTMVDIIMFMVLLKSCGFARFHAVFDTIDLV